jgi:paraquat-inducible protein A
MTADTDSIDMTTGQGLTACPQCDALYRMKPLAMGDRIRCARCGTTLFAPRDGAALTIVCLSVSALILMIVSVSFPFLRIEASGLASTASVLDAILAFARGGGLMAPLSLATATLIVVLPVARICALIYALAPLAVGRSPFPQAARAFRFSMRLQPWAMAEIFMIGVAVAVIKIAGLAHVEFGAAFWAFGGLVALVAFKDMVLCEKSIWQQLTPSRH